MAVKLKRLTLHLRIFIMILWAANVGAGYCPYGQRCTYQPAPPGRTPPCVKPGFTYCTKLDTYPEKLIQDLIEGGLYDIRTLLIDESRDDFNSNKKDTHPYDYGPNSLPDTNKISLTDYGYPKDYSTNFHRKFNDNDKVPLQPPSIGDPTPYNIKAYQASNYSKFNVQSYLPPSPGSWNPINQYEYDSQRLRQSSDISNINAFNPNYFNSHLYQNYESDWLRASSGVTHYNPSEWWKYISPSRSDADVTVQRSITFPTRTSTIHKRRRRNAELVKAAAAKTLTGAEALRIALGLTNEDASAETARPRRRRQAADTQELCRASVRYENPQAGMNNQGDWRYIVNSPNNMTQRVRVEICESTQSECSGLCSLPNRYSSRCDQKFIQKRLVALESSGQNLYTDVFWIPSCCQCTIINNN